MPDQLARRARVQFLLKVEKSSFCWSSNLVPIGTQNTKGMVLDSKNEPYSSSTQHTFLEGAWLVEKPEISFLYSIKKYGTSLFIHSTYYQFLTENLTLNFWRRGNDVTKRKWRRMWVVNFFAAVVQELDAITIVLNSTFGQGFPHFCQWNHI